MGWTNIAQQSLISALEEGMPIYNPITWSLNLLSQCTTEASTWEQLLSTCLRHCCLYESSSTWLNFLQPYPSTT